MSVLVLGYGYAGSRFARAIRALERLDPGLVRLAGICDSSAAVRASVEDVPCFAEVDSAVESLRPDAVLVSVNESAHAHVLGALTRYRPTLVMCEKPLTATLSEAEALPPTIRESALTVNLVERQSPILDSYFEWAATRSGLRPLRVEFFWGKHRVADQRPTIGVLSEISHPLDLVDHVFGFSEFTISQLNGTSSNYTPHHASSVDSLDFVGTADRYPVVGHASFVWPRRHRTLTALLTDATSGLFRVTMDFDSPRWDWDRITIGEADLATGACRPVLECVVEGDPAGHELEGIRKVASFVRASVLATRAVLYGRELVDLNQALKVQRLLALFECKLERSTAHFDVIPVPLAASMAQPLQGVDLSDPDNNGPDGLLQPVRGSA
jgi:predicted dehydrogenase